MPKVTLGVKLYTTGEVADLLGVCTASVHKYTKDGRLNAKTIGGKKYYSEESLKQFLLRDETKTIIK